MPDGDEKKRDAAMSRRRQRHRERHQFSDWHIARHSPPVHERAHPPPDAPPPLNCELTVLTREFPFLHPDRLEQGLAERLHRLADDLSRIGSGEAPTAEDLDGVPVLDQWQLVRTSLGMRLIGKVRGHPRLRVGEIMTSQVWVVDPAGDWVRTMSRFYRLGVRSRKSDVAETGDDLIGAI